MSLGTGRWTLGIGLGLVGLVVGLVLVLPRDRAAPVTRSSSHVEHAEMPVSSLVPAALDRGAAPSLRTEIATETQVDDGAAPERSSTEDDDPTDEDFDSDEAEPLWAFHGMVIDALTREPVPNAEVFVDYRGIGLQSTTDTRGRFTWEIEEGYEHVPFPLPAETVRVCVMVEDPLWRRVFEGEGRLSTFHVIEAGGALKWARGRVESNGPWPYGEGFLLDIVRFGEAEEYDAHLARATVDGDGEFAVPLIADPSLDDLFFSLWNDSSRSRYWVVPSIVPLQRSAGSVLVLEAELARATLTMDRALSAPGNSPDELRARTLGRLQYDKRRINPDEPVDVLFFGPSIDVVGIREDHYAERVQLRPGASVVLRPRAVPWSTVNLNRPDADVGNDGRLYVVGIPVTTAELDGDLWLELADWARWRAPEYLEGVVNHRGLYDVPRQLLSFATFGDDGTCELSLPWTGPWLVFTGTASGELLRIGHIADPTSGVVWRE